LQVADDPAHRDTIVRARARCQSKRVADLKQPTDRYQRAARAASTYSILPGT
jgi:hypothetical protein